MLSRIRFLRFNTLNRILVSECGKGLGFYSTASPTSDCSEPKCTPKGQRAELMDVACKVAIITGGTSGIGYACAQQLLCNGLQKAVIAGINKCEGDAAAKSLSAEFGKSKAVFYKVDVNCEKQFDDLFKEVLKCNNRIDILINNAGMLNDRNWELEVETNLKGVIRGTLLAFKYMAANGSGHRGNGGIVINVSSTLGLDACPPIPIYSVTKHGVIGLVKNLGADYHFKDTKLRVTAMCPGKSPTALSKDAVGKQYTDKWGQDAQLTMAKWPKQPLGDCGKACVHMVKHAKSGSVFVIEGSKLYRVDIPERVDISKYVKSFL